jgi:hypothetical protein
MEYTALQDVMHRRRKLQRSFPALDGKKGGKLAASPLLDRFFFKFCSTERCASKIQLGVYVQ